jgi:hypothetical protein
VNIKLTLAGALTLAIAAVPSLAFAQQSGGYSYGPVAPYTAPEPVAFTRITIVPPAYGSVFLYDGRRLVGRFDGPGALWMPSGRVYGVTAMRGDQVLWNGSANVTGGVPVDLRWPAPPGWSPRTQCPYGYPTGPLTEPVELGRVRTPTP